MELANILLSAHLTTRYKASPVWKVRCFSARSYLGGISLGSKNNRVRALGAAC